MDAFHREQERQLSLSRFSNYLSLKTRCGSGSGGGGGGGGGERCMSVVYRCVKKKKSRERVLFSSWAVRSAVIIKGRKNAIFVEKGYVFFLQFYKRSQK